MGRPISGFLNERSQNSWPGPFWIYRKIDETAKTKKGTCRLPFLFAYIDREIALLSAQQEDPGIEIISFFQSNGVWSAAEP